MNASLFPTIREVLGTHFGLTAEDVDRLAGGETNESWVADTDAGRLVIRRSHRDRHPDQVAREHRVQAVMARDLAFVPTPMPGTDGETVQVWNGEIYSVWPFLAGEKADVHRRDHRVAIARTLAAIHLTSQRYDAELRPAGDPPSTGWPLPGNWVRVREQLPAGFVEDLIPLFDEENSITAEWIDRLADRRPDLPVGFIHGDPNDRNILMTGDQVSGVVDWDGTRPSWFAAEVAKVAALDDEGSNECLTAYLDAGGPFDPKDAHLLPMFMRWSQVNEVLWAVDPEARDGLHRDAERMLRDDIAAKPAHVAPTNRALVTGIGQSARVPPDRGMAQRCSKRYC